MKPKTNQHCKNRHSIYQMDERNNYRDTPSQKKKKKKILYGTVTYRDPQKVAILLT